MRTKLDKFRKSNEDEIETNFYFYKLFQIKQISTKNQELNKK
jgi:hypothetical protein